MPDKKNISTLKIHRLSQEQYDRELAADNIDPDAFYLTPERPDNPPMIFGEEYLTNEYWNGKPVYTMVIDLGAFPNNAVTETNFTINELYEIVSFDVIAHDHSLDMYYKLPIIHYDSNPTIVCVAHILYRPDNNIILVKAFDENLTDYTGKAVIKYTKTT